MLDRQDGLTKQILWLLTGIWFIGAVLDNAAQSDEQNGFYNNGLYIGFALAPLLFSDNETSNGTTIEFDTGVGFGALIGYKRSHLRLEAELAYQTVEGTSATDVNADISNVRFTGAAYYDFDQWALKPYLGGGIGITSLDTSGDFENEDTAFTAHAEAGLTLDLTERLALLPAYRYEWTDTDLGGFDKALTAHAFRITLRYLFATGSRQTSRESYRYEPAPPYPYPRGYEYSPYYRYDPYYDPYYYRPPERRPKPRESPEKIERDRCGWDGPGCPPRN